VLAGLVDSAISKCKLITQSKTELAEPAVVGARLADPDGAGMVGVCLLVGARGKATRVNDPVGAVEKLSGFKDHLYDMFVAMMNRCKAGAEVEEEDIHDGRDLLG